MVGEPPSQRRHQHRSANNAKMNEFAKLSNLMTGHGWGRYPESLQSALKMLEADPGLAQNQWHVHGDKRGGFLLHHLLAYKDIAVEHLAFVADLYPEALTKFDFLHCACSTPGIKKHVIQFFLQRCPNARQKWSYAFDEKYPFALYFERCSMGPPVSLEEASTSTDWEEVRQVCDLLWIEGEDDFVDLAVEKECWPMVQYFVEKASKKYWEQKDPDEAWKHRPPSGALTKGSLDIVDQLLLPKFPRKAFELELPAPRWNSLDILFPWLANYADLRLLYLHSKDEGNTHVIPPRFTDALFESLSLNQSLEDFRMSGNYHASWRSFAQLLHHAPPELLTCNLSLFRDTPLNPSLCNLPLDPAQCALRKLDLFRIKLDPRGYLDLMQLLVTLPLLQDLEMIVDMQGDDSDEEEEEEDDDNSQDGKLSVDKITHCLVRLAEKERLQRLTFGPGPVGVVPMSQLLKHNKSLRMFKGFFRDEEEKGVFPELMNVMKNHNRTLQEYGHCDFIHPPDDTDTTLGGLRQDFLFYTRLNRINRDVLGRPQATLGELIDSLLSIRIMLADDVIEGVLGSETIYSFELLRLCPLLWTGPSLEPRRGKRKLSNGHDHEHYL